MLGTIMNVCIQLLSATKKKICMSASSIIILALAGSRNSAGKQK